MPIFARLVGRPNIPRPLLDNLSSTYFHNVLVSFAVFLWYNQWVCLDFLRCYFLSSGTLYSKQVYPVAAQQAPTTHSSASPALESFGRCRTTKLNKLWGCWRSRLDPPSLRRYWTAWRTREMGGCRWMSCVKWRMPGLRTECASGQKSPCEVGCV